MIPNLVLAQKIRLTKGKSFTPTVSGYFLSDSALAKIISTTETEKKQLLAKIKKLKDTVELKVEHKDLLCNVKLEAKDNKYKALLDLKSTQKKEYSKLLERVQPKWYENPYLHFILGVVSATTVGIVSYQISK